MFTPSIIQIPIRYLDICLDGKFTSNPGKGITLSSQCAASVELAQHSSASRVECPQQLEQLESVTQVFTAKQTSSEDQMTTFPVNGSVLTPERVLTLQYSEIFNLKFHQARAKGQCAHLLPEHAP